MVSVLVVGGGVTGIQCSLSLARMGHQVCLVEKEKELGGNLRNLHTIYPTNEDASQFLLSLTEEVRKHEKISIMTQSKLIDIKEESQGFKAKLMVAGKSKSITIDAVALATGFTPYNPATMSEYKYGKLDDVVTSIDLERMLKNDDLSRPSDSEKPSSIAFIQCVGFRDSRAYEYCSSFCCTLAIKNAVLLKNAYPETQVTVFYMDIRTPYLYEELYEQARNIGVRFVRARPAEITERNKKLVLSIENTLTSEIQHVESDLVVLSVGGTPPPETDALSHMFNITLDECGFFKVQRPPSETSCKRIFVAGSACGPKDISYSLAQAGATASQINTLVKE